MTKTFNVGDWVYNKSYSYGIIRDIRKNMGLFDNEIFFAIEIFFLSNPDYITLYSEKNRDGIYIVDLKIIRPMYAETKQ